MPVSVKGRVEHKKHNHTAAAGLGWNWLVLAATDSARLELDVGLGWVGRIQFRQFKLDYFNSFALLQRFVKNTKL